MKLVMVLENFEQDAAKLLWRQSHQHINVWNQVGKLHFPTPIYFVYASLSQRQEIRSAISMHSGLLIFLAAIDLISDITVAFTVNCSAVSLINAYFAEDVTFSH